MSFDLKSSIEKLNEHREHITKIIDDEWIPASQNLLEKYCLEELFGDFEEHRSIASDHNAKKVDNALSRVVAALPPHIAPQNSSIQSRIDKYKDEVRGFTTGFTSYIKNIILTRLKDKQGLMRAFINDVSSFPSPDVDPRKKFELIDKMNYKTGEYIGWLHYMDSYIKALNTEIKRDQINGGDIARDFLYYDNQYVEWAKKYKDTDEAGRNTIVFQIYKDAVAKINTK